MRVAVVGLGMAGSTLACLLADRGVDVVVLEQEDDPRPVGAGIWLQHMGQQVLDRLGLLGALRAQSREVSRVDIRTSSGRQLVDASYADVPGSVPALGVHRGTLFSLLLSEVRRRGIPLELGVPVTGVRPVPGGLAVETPSGDHGTYDLVVGCDGSQSRVRRSMNVATRDHAYDYGALWTIVDDPDELCADELYQCLRGTRQLPRRAADRARQGVALLVRARLRDGRRGGPRAAGLAGRRPPAGRADGPAARPRRPPAARVLPRRRRADAVPDRLPSRRQSGCRRARRRRRARDEPAARHRHLARARRRLDAAPRPRHPAVAARPRSRRTPRRGPRTCAGTSGGPG